MYIFCSFFLLSLGEADKPYLLRSDVFNDMPADAWKSSDVVTTTVWKTLKKWMHTETYTWLYHSSLGLYLCGSALSAWYIECQCRGRLGVLIISFPNDPKKSSSGMCPHSNSIISLRRGSSCSCSEWAQISPFLSRGGVIYLPRLGEALGVVTILTFSMDKTLNTV